MDEIPALQAAIDVLTRYRDAIGNAPLNTGVTRINGLPSEDETNLVIANLSTLNVYVKEA